MQAGDTPGGCPGAAGGGHDKHGAAALLGFFNLTEGAALEEGGEEQEKGFWLRKVRRRKVSRPGVVMLFARLSFIGRSMIVNSTVERSRT